MNLGKKRIERWGKRKKITLFGGVARTTKNSKKAKKVKSTKKNPRFRLMNYQVYQVLRVVLPHPNWNILSKIGEIKQTALRQFNIRVS